MVGKLVRLCDHPQQQRAIKRACNYEDLANDKRSFTLNLMDGSILEKVYASQHKIMLVY